MGCLLNGMCNVVLRNFLVGVGSMKCALLLFNIKINIPKNGEFIKTYVYCKSFEVACDP